MPGSRLDADHPEKRGLFARRFTRYRSAQHWLDVFKSYYGPLLKTFGALDPETRTALTDDLFELIKRFNRSGDKTMVVPSEYLEVVVTRQ